MTEQVLASSNVIGARVDKATNASASIPRSVSTGMLLGITTTETVRLEPQYVAVKLFSKIMSFSLLPRKLRPIRI